MSPCIDIMSVSPGLTWKLPSLVLCTVFRVCIHSVKNFIEDILHVLWVEVYETQEIFLDPHVLGFINNTRSMQCSPKNTLALKLSTQNSGELDENKLTVGHSLLWGCSFEYSAWPKCIFSFVGEYTLILNYLFKAILLYSKFLPHRTFSSF